MGIDCFCFSPGSRSNPLLFALKKHSHIKKVVHFDERGISFFALGYGKVWQKPAVLFVTSGTAVGNLYPAVMEGSLSRTPLIVLTADRPQEYFKSGANQSCDQQKIFSLYANQQYDVSFSDPLLNPEFFTHLSKKTFEACMLPYPGIAHVNCQFREPLLTDIAPTIPSSKDIYISWPEYRISEKALVDIKGLINKKKKGLIVIGECRHPIAIHLLENLSKKLQWPIYADLTSKIKFRHAHIISSYSLNEQIADQIEIVLHIGGKLVDKQAQKIFKKVSTYVMVNEDLHPQDPENVASHKYVSDLTPFVRDITNLIDDQTDISWLKKWQTHSIQIFHVIDSYFNEHNELSEPYLFWSLNHKNMAGLFIGNSTPIRTAHLLFHPKKLSHFLGTNRGLSGIDGNIATSLGMSLALKSPMICVLGDLTALHDLNSLAMLKNHPFPMTIIVLNNQGGGIFSSLPIPDKGDFFEEYVATTHEWNFSKIAEAFQLNHETDLNFSSYQKNLVEISIDKNKTAKIMTEISEMIKKI